MRDKKISRPCVANNNYLAADTDRPREEMICEEIQKRARRFSPCKAGDAIAGPLPPGDTIAGFTRNSPAPIFLGGLSFYSNPNGLLIPSRRHVVSNGFRV